jgi:hypothetical protein
MAVTDQTNDDHMDINLRTLKRNDPAVKDILGSASQVAAYEYSESTWKKLDIEGSLFLVSRNTAPFYSIIINNRLSTENLIEPITPDYEFRLDMQNGSAFLMVHNNAVHKISCIWFYEGDELLAVHKKIESILATIKSQIAKKRIAANVNSMSSNEPVENVLAKLGIMTGNGRADANQSSSSQSSANAPSCLTANLAPSASSLQAPATENLLQSLFANSVQNSGKPSIQFEL